MQYKQDKTWLRYSKCRGKGLAQSKTHTWIDGNGKTRTEIQTKWTEKGR